MLAPAYRHGIALLKPNGEPAKGTDDLSADRGFDSELPRGLLRYREARQFFERQLRRAR